MSHEFWTALSMIDEAVLCFTINGYDSVCTACRSGSSFLFAPSCDGTANATLDSSSSSSPR